MATDQSIERRLGHLRIWNLVVGLILAAQAVLIAILTNRFSLPVTAATSKPRFWCRLASCSVSSKVCS